ncbi:uncharacterized protein I206_107310 [Kwoniella pini CBS 10737]|uniref:DUF1996 domain-containing protein n=1 Tax=Kwoniella pini CBS 10737 TaxID=1296096 RepID=A0A1B9HYK7_9TREE|nr:uncharacterized protein I206_05146 [Kwoniella pini CBS 10737]OCF48369.1 hypothetical protein I206_05146 [Kwoniella pini CBS 10737]
MSSLFALVALLAGVSVSADPFFVVQHGTAAFTTRLDPIVSPGGVSSHVHSVIGSSSFKNEYSYDNNRNGKCTTANIVEDLSNYWAPQLYRKQDNGTFELFKMNRANTYYLMRRQPDEEVHEFPPGFMMLAGNAKRSTYDENDYTNAAISYTCLGVSGKADTHAFPEYSCPDDLRANIFFPNCWDGVNNWLEGSKHVAYPASGGHDSGGPCPATHPKRIMSLFYEFHFTDRYDYKSGARVWANGDDVGYSLHGDFTTGWPTGLFPKVFDAGESCNVGFSIENCPVLEPIFTHNGGGTCTPDDPSVLIDEDVGEHGAIPALPGNNPVWSGNGAPAAANSTVSASSVINSGISSSSISVASSSVSHKTGTSTSSIVSTTTFPSSTSASGIGAINLVATGTSTTSGGKCKAKKRRLPIQL